MIIIGSVAVNFKNGRIFFSTKAIILNHGELTPYIPLDINIIGLNEMKDLSYPFLRDTFLQALEDSGSVSAETGWTPIHLELKDKELNCFMPLYLKDHSMG